MMMMRRQSAEPRYDSLVLRSALPLWRPVDEMLTSIFDNATVLVLL